MVEQFSSFAKDTTEWPRHSEDELAMGNVEADGLGDPVAGLANAALVAAWAEVAGFAGEGEELFMPAIGTEDAGETSREIAAAVELVDDIHGIGSERSVNFAVSGLVIALEIRPCVMNDLPKR